MTANDRRRSYIFFVIVATAAIDIGAGDCDAQYGMDMGFFGGFNPVPSPTNFINSHALIRAGQGSTSPTLRINNHPDSAANRARNDGFSSHYGLDSRRSPAFEVDRRRTPGAARASTGQAQATPTPAPTSPAPAARPVLPIGTFFDAARKLVWPSESPVADGLLAKREISDEACLTVADKVDRYRSSPITLVTEARLKLLAYGQPALQMIRSTSTPRIAEGFHNFLLSLYDSLADAANPSATPSATNSAH